MSAMAHLNQGHNFERVDLDATSWVDISRGHIINPTQLFETLRDEVGWKQTRLFRYEKLVEERRLGGSWRRGQQLPHPVLGELTKQLQDRYKVYFTGFSMIQYRDGNDGQGFHSDSDMAWLADTIIVILTLGATRPWYLRPVSSAPHGQPTHDISPANGDVHVLGGACQQDWQHSVAYQKFAKLEPRISLQWRAVKTKQSPYRGASRRAPVTYENGLSAPFDPRL